MNFIVKNHSIFFTVFQFLQDSNLDEKNGDVVFFTRAVLTQEEEIYAGFENKFQLIIDSSFRHKTTWFENEAI